jgi:phosphomannomutase
MSAFSHLESIYRNYDIRGRYPEEITDEEVEKIGRAVAVHFKVKKVAVGYDIRPSSIPLKNALVKGLTESGVHVINLGLVTTPMTYYVCGSTDVDATVMITASHMPSEFNGLKIAIDDAKPVTKDVLQELKRIVGEHTFSNAETIGVIEDESPLTKWQSKFKAAYRFGGRPLKLVIDPANMIGAVEIETFRQFEPDIDVVAIYDDFDHTTPNHEANPIVPETLHDLGSAVREHGADLGIGFDGDADRVGFVDELGQFVAADIAGALMVRAMLQKNPGATIVYDLRSSLAVRDEILKYGGMPVEWKVGHTNIRTKMRELDAIMGIELAGHYFFKETYFSEGGPLPAFLILELLHESGQPLSKLVREIRTHHHSGEINSEIHRSVDEIYKDLQNAFPNGEVSNLDGLKIVFKDWWFNVRPSANDPVLRLNVEAVSYELMVEKRDELLSIIRS